MKTSFLLSIILFLTGCVIGTSSEIKIAEKLLNQFQCNNVETSQLTHSAITSYYEQSLAASKQKATTYIESYKSGDELFDLPLNEVVQQQYVVYTEACHSLGGIQKIQPTVAL